jgi:cytochrome c oxidase subunit 2
VLFWIMLGGGTAILLLVTIATALAVFGGDAVKRRLQNERMIVQGGIVLPIVVLTALLFYGFWLLDDESDAADTRALRIAVIGEQWWWRVRYLAPDGTVVETANELRIPVDRPVQLELTTHDVIHSFWVPSLAGKVDMVPGHVNTLTLTPRTRGIYRGQCAEYCGGAHALMSFYVVVETADAFEAWLSRQGTAADDAPASALFRQSGCGGCHAIRGSGATGTIGPDLTHVGGRLSIGAGVLRTSREAFAQWLQFHRTLKPDNEMPPFDALSASDYDRLATYLASLD